MNVIVALILVVANAVSNSSHSDRPSSWSEEACKETISRREASSCTRNSFASHASRVSNVSLTQGRCHTARLSLYDPAGVNSCDIKVESLYHVCLPRSLMRANCCNSNLDGMCGRTIILFSSSKKAIRATVVDKHNWYPDMILLNKEGMERLGVGEGDGVRWYRERP